MSPALQAVWRLAAREPQLLATHAAGYVALMRNEAADSMQQVLLRVRLQAAVFGGVLAGVVLTGVALMLGAVLPQQTPLATVLLVVVPLLPLALSAWALHVARQLGPLPLWTACQRQLAADSALLQGDGGAAPAASPGSRSGS